MDRRLDSVVVTLTLVACGGTCCGTAVLVERGWAGWLMLPAVAFVGLVAAACHDQGRTDRRTRSGLCLTCGYDLRGSPGRCPECGRDAGRQSRRSQP